MSTKSQETIISDEIFMYSIPYFFIKSKFKLTNKRIEGEIPNLLWIIPTGKDNVTYPINNISGIKLSTKFYLRSFIIGLIITLFGLGMFTDTFFGALIFILLGVVTVLNAFRTLLVIENNGGSSISYAIAPTEKSKALEFVNKTNNIIAARL